MAKASGTDLAGFDAQLATTQMFYEPAEAVAFTKSPKLPKTMDFVRKFLFDHGILGRRRPSATSSASGFADGTMLGDEGEREAPLRSGYMEMPRREL